MDRNKEQTKAEERVIRSMTGFATQRGAGEGYEWAWDMRSVNGRGLDLRLRVPDWVAGLEAGLRKRLGTALSRGSVSVGLRVSRVDCAASLALDPAALDAALTAITRVEERALERGVTLGPSRAADVLAMRGVLDTRAEEADTAPLLAAVLEDFEGVLAAFLEMRAREGAALEEVLRSQLDRISALTEDAVAAAEARRGASEEAFRAALARVMDGAATADPDRVAQELALLAVKADITEELDRLHAHVGAARALLDEGGTVGRKLDFLSQEFNREANTLCSKSQNAELTRIGLDLKAVIDQMREQIQNVE